MRIQHKTTKNSTRALEESFRAYGVKLYRVEVFKYLGRLLASNDNDTQAMQSNL